MIKPVLVITPSDLADAKPLSAKKAIVYIITSLTILGIFIGLCSIPHHQYNTEFHVGEIVCTTCGSHNTEGYHTLWKKDGTLAKNKSQADYTIMHCHSCGNSWKYYF